MNIQNKKTAASPVAGLAALCASKQTLTRNGDRLRPAVEKQLAIAKTGARLAALVLGCSTLEEAEAIPNITSQPPNRSISIGARARFFVVANGIPPLSYVWRFNETNLAGATQSSLIVSNASIGQAGGYAVVVSDSTGSVTSRVAVLTVDPTFTKITSGSVVSDGGNFQGVGWEDLDNDGDSDLLISNLNGTNGFYMNVGNGTFDKVTGGPIVTNRTAASSHSLADYDNDGNVDVFIANFSGDNLLYRNLGNGTFEQIKSSTRGTIVSDGGSSSACAWSDYDKDGYLDLVVANSANRNFLYRNLGNGTFAKITNSVVTAHILNNPFGTAWADYNNDGYADLFVANGGSNPLYKNGANGFQRITNSLTLAQGSDGATWGDLDNDGDLDLFVTNMQGGTMAYNSLFRNDRGTNFTRIASAPFNSDTGSSLACTFGDHDNDGDLDIFVANGFAVGGNYLYINNGNWRFTKHVHGSLVNDTGSALGCAWNDLDNDGDLDLAVAYGSIGGSQTNNLYLNNGNPNHYMKIKLEGTSSNRQGLSAKIRMNATIAGSNTWQLREVTAGDEFSGSGSTVHFGLGDATNANVLRVEWPSGIIQELSDVEADQHLQLSEPTRLKILGAGRFEFRAWSGQEFTIEGSPDGKVWETLAFVTNATASSIFQYSDPASASIGQRFYRVRNGVVSSP